MAKYVWILLFYCCIQIHKVAAQDFPILNFTSFTSAQGLSQNSGYCITQDVLGYLWAGTQDGLNKFNGNRIVSYYRDNVKRGVLPNNHIKALFYDSSKNWIWIGTAGGLAIYDCRKDSFYLATTFFEQADTLNGLMIRSIVQGRKKTEVIIVTASEGLFICDTKTFTSHQYLMQPDTKSRTDAAIAWNNKIITVANKKIYEITDTPIVVANNLLLDDIRQLFFWQGSLWAASTKSGALMINVKDMNSIKITNCGSNDVGSFASDKYNNLWVGTRAAGIVILEPSNQSIVNSFSSAPNQNEWPRKFTLSIFKDRQSNMWVGSSGGGIAVKYGSKKEFELIQKTELQYGKVAHNMTLSIYKHTGNQLFMGTQLEGLRMADISIGSIVTYKNPHIPAANSVYSITATSPYNLWLATLAGLYQFNCINKKFTHFIDSSIAPSTRGQFVYKLKSCDSLLYSSNLGTVFFDLKKLQFHKITLIDQTGSPFQLVIQHAIEDGKGNLWIGSTSNGLIKYEMHSGKFIILEETKRFSKSVNAVLIDGDTLWASTSNGVFLYNLITNKIIRTFSISNGLLGNVMYSIEKDKLGNFWFGSNVGLIKIDKSLNKITQVKASAGLQADEFNTSCSTKDSRGNLYFGGINGVTWFNPAKFIIEKFSPRPLIESIKIGNKELNLSVNINTAQEINLLHNQNFITIEFGVNNFINYEECSFKYQLLGADADWVNSNNRSLVNYSGLKPGEYNFQLQSSNSYGIWSELTRLKIIISPAWWQTSWFIIASILTMAVLIIFFIVKRIKHIRFKADLKQRITETEMSALKAQMNPHFIFNCINSIDAFIHSNDKYNATFYLNKFAKLLRNILDSSKQNVVAFTKDIDTLKLYIELEELRHENKFETSLDIDDDLLNNDYKVPPLIIQPFVENAILHGLKNREDNNGLLQIAIKKVADSIEYTIKDNGIGRKAAGLIVQNKTSSYGMQMSYDRIKLFNKEEKPSVEITDLYNEGIANGTEVKVLLNLI